MLSIFKGNSTFQVVCLVVFFLGIRLSVLIFKVPLLVPELNWMLVGEQMNRGFILYSDIWDNTSPLSACVYWAIDYFVGRSQLAYQGVAVAISLFQVLYFNYMIANRDVFPRRNYVPGLLYALLLNISFDLTTLSPTLMATTFLLLAMGGFIKILARRQVTNEVFEVGLYIGIATLFYLPTYLFVIWMVTCLLFYTGANIRHHLLGFFGSVFPMLMVILLFYLNDGLDSLNRNLFASVFKVNQFTLPDFYTLIATLTIPMILGVLGLFRIFTYSRFVHFQTQVQQTMAIWFIVSLLTVPLMQYLAPSQFILSIPAIAFFASNYFESFKKRIQSELIFLVSFGGVLFFLYNGILGILPQAFLGRLDNMKAKPALLPKEIAGRKILVLGVDEGEYINNFTATPYLNWNLARYDLQNLNNFESVIHVSNNFKKDPPEYIIDKEKLMPKIFQRIPDLKHGYRQSQWKDIYEKTDQNP